MKNYIYFFMEKRNKLLQEIEQSMPIPPQGIRIRDLSEITAGRLHKIFQQVPESFFRYTPIDFAENYGVVAELVSIYGSSVIVRTTFDLEGASSSERMLREANYDINASIYTVPPETLEGMILSTFEKMDFKEEEKDETEKETLFRHMKKKDMKNRTLEATLAPFHCIPYEKYWTSERFKTKVELFEKLMGIQGVISTEEELREAFDRLKKRSEGPYHIQTGDFTETALNRKTLKSEEFAAYAANTFWEIHIAAETYADDIQRHLKSKEAPETHIGFIGLATKEDYESATVDFEKIMKQRFTVS